jgi:hypothetical protein
VLQFTYYYIFISHVHIFIVIFLSEWMLFSIIWFKYYYIFYWNYIYVTFQKIWATCEIGEYLLSTVNPRVNNNAEAPVPILDETFQKVDPSIDNAEIKFLTSDMEKLLNATVASQLVSYFIISSTFVLFWVWIPLNTWMFVLVYSSSSSSFTCHPIIDTI